MKRLIFIKTVTLCWIFAGTVSMAQEQTIGLFSNTADSYNGYTLFAPMTSTTTYLINNCGEEIHSWPSEYKPGLSAYVLDDGTLLRTRNTSNANFDAGGSGGGIEMLDWNGNVIWEYTISTSDNCQHHDVEYLPNGNILAVVWDAKTSEEASLAGRNVSGETLWTEKIIEIEPDLVNGGATIVWEWKAWDHLVQDVDEDKINYGVVSESPELININFFANNPTMEDWLHINSVAYNEEFDQIILSSHSFSEVWIIDHSTTTNEATSNSGGTYNKGGDLLYRWGNPQAYNQGTEANQLLFKQHDAHWIDSDFSDGGMIMVFNNQAGSPSEYSEINIINPPVDEVGNYSYSGTSYEPSEFHWTYQAAVSTDFYASNISGAQRLPNGNTLICEGPSGNFFEVNYEGTIVWEYVNPVSMFGILAQGETANKNDVFRCTRYAIDYSGFNGQTLNPQGYIESGSTFSCDLYTSVIKPEKLNLNISIYPQPAKNNITVSTDCELASVSIYTTHGVKVVSRVVQEKETTINMQNLSNGMYLLEVITSDGNRVSEKIMIIN